MKQETLDQGSILVVLLPFKDKNEYRMPQNKYLLN